MKIEVFTPERASEVRQFVLDVLEGEGFGYDPVKDFDLEDIWGYYIDNGGVFYIGTIDGVVVGTGAIRRINSKKCEIKRIYVNQEFRGQGFGEELFLNDTVIGASHSLQVILDHRCNGCSTSPAYDLGGIEPEFVELEDTGLHNPA